MLSKYGNCACLLKIKNKLKIFCFYKYHVWKNSRYFVSVLNKTIIPLALVGYEMIVANEARKSQLGATRTRWKQWTSFIADIVWTLC